VPISSDRTRAGSVWCSIGPGRQGDVRKKNRERTLFGFVFLSKTNAERSNAAGTQRERLRRTVRAIWAEGVDNPSWGWGSVSAVTRSGTRPHFSRRGLSSPAVFFSVGPHRRWVARTALKPTGVVDDGRPDSFLLNWTEGYRKACGRSLRHGLALSFCRGCETLPQPAGNRDIVVHTPEITRMRPHLFLQPVAFLWRRPACRLGFGSHDAPGADLRV
jgi:hypothetical protein